MKKTVDVLSKGGSTQALSVLSFGAGAIGTYVGGSLALRNHQVVFLERPSVIDTLRNNGLHLQIGEQLHHIRHPIVVDTIEAALSTGHFDVALFALKAYDTDAVLDKLQNYRSQLPPLLCLQNGVENEVTLAAALGSEKVIAGTVTSAIGRRAAGDIVLERLRGLGIANNLPISQELADKFTDAGLNASLYQNADGMKWSKMLTNLISNASSAILGIPPSEVFSHPGLYRLEVGQLREALNVMRAMQIPVTNLPGTPVRLLAFAIRSMPTWLSQPFIRRSVGSGRGNKMPSFYIDLKSGQKKSEVAYINGAVARYGQRLGIRTPINHFFTETLLQLTTGELPVTTYTNQPDRLITDFKKFTG
jgi:2-dehydropantoate 2-reductase